MVFGHNTAIDGPILVKFCVADLRRSFPQIPAFHGEPISRFVDF